MSTCYRTLCRHSWSVFMKLFSLFSDRDDMPISKFPKYRPLSKRLMRASVGAVGVALVATAAFAGGPKAYVGNFKDNTVSVIDTATGEVVATVPVVAGPHGMGVTPDGRRGCVSGG